MRYILLTTIVAILTIAPYNAFAQNESGGALERLGRMLGIEQQDTELTSVPSAGFQPVQSSGSEIIVLSHGFNTDVYPEVVGEVQNNDTRSYDKFDVNIVANFRDASGALVSSEEGYIDAETLSPGDRSAFNVLSFDESLPDKATTYDLIVNDDRVVVDEPLEGGDSEQRQRRGCR